MAEARAALEDGRGDAEVDDLVRGLEALDVQPRRRLPPPICKPVAQPVDIAGRRLVYFDLEATGFGRHSHITQVAAVNDQNEIFSRFVLPKINITKEAQEVTGITCDGRQMYHHGEPVPSLTITQALEELLRFLGDEPVVVVGHNAKVFDCPILLNALQACHLAPRFTHDFIDTLTLFKDIIDPRLPGYKLSSLYSHYCGGDFPAHDAGEDVKALKRIVDEAKPDQTALHRHSFSFQYVTELQEYNATKKNLLSAWNVLVRKNVIRKSMAEKAADSGLSWDTVCQVFQSEGEEGIRDVLRDRLTKRGQIIDNICQHLSKTLTPANAQ